MSVVLVRSWNRRLTECLRVVVVAAGCTIDEGKLACWLEPIKSWHNHKAASTTVWERLSRVLGMALGETLGAIGAQGGSAFQ